jgi:putative DNA primase/helicase
MDSISSISTTATDSLHKYLLNAADRDYLRHERKLGIGWEYENFRSLTAAEVGGRLGYDAPSSGIAFLDAQGDLWQFRPWEPWLNKKKEPVKYLTPKKEYDAFLAKHPEIEAYWADLVALKARCFTIDGKPYILITEGGFKSLAGCMHGIPTVGLCGVWFGETKEDAEGKRQLVPALKRLAEAGFNFIIAFDSDTKPETVKNVRAAEKRLAKHLKTYGCDVLSITGHWEPEEGKGMDDFINNEARGIEAFRAILMQATPIDETLDTRENRKTKKPPTARETAAEVGGEYQPTWKYDNEQKTWRIWNNKCWEKTEIGVFTSLLQTVLDAKNIPYPGSAYINDVRELLENKLRQPKWQTWDRKRYISFSDCVLDGDTGKSLPHSPGMGFTSYLPYDYNPLEGDSSDPLEALRVNCPSIHKFFRTAMQGDEKKIFKLLAITNAILKHRFFDLQMFVHLVGAPGSGKGTYSRLMEKLVGRDNFKGCKLNRLDDGSTRASIVDKQLVVFADERKPVGIDSILDFTGGDAVSYRELHTKAADAFFYGCILICSNKPIFVGDTTGLERRLCLVHFDNPIPTEKRDHSIESEFDNEIPALIGIALSLSNNTVKLAVQGVGAEKIAEFKAKEWEMKTETNSVATFLDMQLVLEPGASTETMKLFEYYKDFCEIGGFKPLSLVKFPKYLAELLADENLNAKWTKGRPSTFEGLRLRRDLDEHQTHSEYLASLAPVDTLICTSSAPVDAPVESLQSKVLHQLHQLDSQNVTRSENDNNYLPDIDESDLDKDFLPLTGATGAKPAPVRDTTPAPTGATTGAPTGAKPPQCPETAINKRCTGTPADEMREVLASDSTITEKRTAAREVWKRFENVPLAQRQQQRELFWQNLKQTGEENKARLLVFTDLLEGEKLKYVGKEEQYKGLELTAYSADGNYQMTITCLKPDGSRTSWIPAKELKKSL